MDILENRNLRVPLNSDQVTAVLYALANIFFTTKESQMNTLKTYIFLSLNLLNTEGT